MNMKLTLQQINLINLSNRAFDNGNIETGEAYYQAYLLTLTEEK